MNIFEIRSYLLNHRLIHHLRMCKDSSERSRATWNSCYISGFKSGLVHGQKVCNKQTCNNVIKDCDPSSSSNVTNETACRQACRNSLTCRMVTYQPTKVICNVYNCTGCDASIFGNGDAHAVYFCNTGNAGTNTCTSTFQSNCMN